MPTQALKTKTKQETGENLAWKLERKEGEAEQMNLHDLYHNEPLAKA